MTHSARPGRLSRRDVASRPACGARSPSRFRARDLGRDAAMRCSACPSASPASSSPSSRSSVERRPADHLRRAAAAGRHRLVSRWLGRDVRRFANVADQGRRARAATVPRRAGPVRLARVVPEGRHGLARPALPAAASCRVGILGFVVDGCVLAYGLGGVTYAIWRPFLPCNTDVARRVPPRRRAHRHDLRWTLRSASSCYHRRRRVLLLAAPWAVRGRADDRPAARPAAARPDLGRRTGSSSSNAAARSPSTTRRRRCAASSAICTTAPRPGWCRWR